MARFDIAAAKKDGLTDAQIAAYLAPNFDFAAAVKDGKSPEAILNYLAVNSKGPAASPTPTPTPEAPDRAQFFSPESQLTGIDKGVYQAVKGAVKFPFEAAKMQGEAALAGDPMAMIPGGPMAAAEAQRSVGEASGAVQSAKQGDILAALHQALSAIPGIGGMYKDMATDVIQGNPDVAAGKALGNVMTARVAPDIVPPAAQVAAKGIEGAAGAARVVAPYAKRVGVPAAAGAAAGALASPAGPWASATAASTASIMAMDWVKANAKKAATQAAEAKTTAQQLRESAAATTDFIEKTAANKRASSFDEIAKAWEAAADRVKAEEARLEAASAAAEKAAQADSIKAAQIEAKAIETADAATGKQIAAAERAAATGEKQGLKIDLMQKSKQAKRDAQAANNLLRDVKDREAASFKSAGIEARILEAAQKAQASADAELAAANTALERAAVRDAAAAQKAVEAATIKAQKAADRVAKAEELAKNRALKDEQRQIHREFGQGRAEAKAAAKKKPVESAEANPVLAQIEAPAATQPPTVTVPGETGPRVVSPVPSGTDISDTISKATKQNRRLLELGVSLEDRRAVLAKNKNRLPDGMIETIITADNKTPIAPNAVMVKSLMRSGNTPTDAWKIMRDAGVKENGQDAFFQAVRDELSMMKAAADDGTGPALTPQQEFQYAQLRRGVKSTKRLRIEDIKELPEGQKPDKYVPVPKPPKKP